jgi:hypothetical protein
MMMKALSNGGMDSVFDSYRDRMNDRCGDEYYQPNTGGFFEIALKKYQEIIFPLAYRGKLIKVLCWGLPACCVHQYKVAYMLRDFEEIRQSYEGFTRNRLWLRSNEDYQILMQKHINLLRNRRDTDVVAFQFREVVEDPLSAFEELKQHGWPIDPEKCVEVVDENLVRFKTENLDAGISNL